jgi:hypothetical protein
MSQSEAHKTLYYLTDGFDTSRYHLNAEQDDDEEEEEEEGGGGEEEEEVRIKKNNLWEDVIERR